MITFLSIFYEPFQRFYSSRSYYYYRYAGWSLLFFHECFIYVLNTCFAYHQARKFGRKSDRNVFKTNFVLMFFIHRI